MQNESVKVTNTELHYETSLQSSDNSIAFVKEARVKSGGRGWSLKVESLKVESLTILNIALQVKFWQAKCEVGGSIGRGVDHL